MAEQGSKSGEQYKKRPRLSDKAEGSGAKKSSALAMTTVSLAELAARSPVAPRTAPLSSPSPAAKTKPITTVGLTSSLAVMPPAPAAPAPSPVATRTAALSSPSPAAKAKPITTVGLTSPMAVMPPAPAAPAPSPVATRTAALSSPSPAAKAKPITTVGLTSPLAVMTPAPSPVATKSRTLSELNAAATVAMTSPVAAMPPALAAPSPAATRVLAAPSPVATETQTPVLVAIAKPAAVVKAEGNGAGQAGGATVAVTAEEELVNVDLPKKRLHCAACLAALKPPVFKCENEHAVCRACAGGGGAHKHCRPCGHVVTYAHCRYTDGLVDDCKVPCPNKRHGCASSIVYHAAADHNAKCAHAPCYCLQCTPPFEGSPADLLRHLTAPSGKHSWLTDEIKYESRYTLVVPSGDYRSLLVAEDGGVFLLAVSAGRGLPGCRNVNVVCVRGNADADAGTRPLYTGVLWVDGPPAPPGQLRCTFRHQATVASCSVPGEVYMEQGQLHAHVNPNMLQGESGELHLRLCITKFP